MRIAKLLTIKQVAERFQVDPRTVRRWIKAGRIQPRLETPGGRYMFDLAAIERELSFDPRDQRPTEQEEER